MHRLKEQIRAEMRQRLSGLTEDVALRESTAILQGVIALPSWNKAKSILLFWPRADEPAIHGLCWEALKAGKVLALPAYDPETESYLARQVRSLAESELIHGRFGIAEPSPDCPIVPIEQIEFALVPGLAFDRTGARLGRGRGFYDRLLMGFLGFACGIGFRFQEYREIPLEPHDRRMDHVLFG